MAIDYLRLADCLRTKLMSTLQAKYRLFCQGQAQLSVFAQPWWLDAVCGDAGWDVLLWEPEHQIQAALPYRKVKKWGLVRLEMPVLTPFFPLTIVNRQPSDAHQRLSFQKKAIEALLYNLPNHDFHELRLGPETEYMLPFYWHGYELQERYTYRIYPNESYTPSAQARKNIRKAKDLGLQIGDLESTDLLLDIVRSPFERKKLPCPYSNEVLLRTVEAIQRHNAGFLLQAKDREGRVVSAGACVFDSKICYLILGSSTEEGRKQNAEYLLYEACIKKAHSLGLIFDFEGSMLEPIEARNRSFNANPVRYTQLRRYGQRHSIAMAIKRILGKR